MDWTLITKFVIIAGLATMPLAGTCVGCCGMGAGCAGIGSGLFKVSGFLCVKTLVLLNLPVIM